MKTLFIGYPKCTTCKKAYAALCDLGIEAEYRNIKEENPTKERNSKLDRIKVFLLISYSIPAVCFIEN